MSTMHVAVVLGLVAISCIANIYSGGVTFNRYKQCVDVNSANGTQTNCKGDVIEAKTAYLCASHCEENEKCNYVVYNKISGMCHLLTRDPEPEKEVTWKCQQVTDCGPSPSIRNANSYGRKTVYGSKAYYVCKYGYNPRTYVSITCQADGTWEDLTLDCEPRNCGKPPGIDVHEVFYMTTTYLSPALYTCAHGYKAMNRGRSWCGSYGYWYRACKAIDCGSPPDDSIHTIDYKETTFQSKATYTCGKGYNTLNDGVSVCQENEEWTEVCEVNTAEVDCGPPPHSDKDTVMYNRTTYLAEAVYSCALGYYIEGPSVCQADSSWSLQCKEIPNLRGTHYLPDSIGAPSCRNVHSRRVGRGWRWSKAVCDEDEILTGCSIKSSSARSRHGSYIYGHNRCMTTTYYGDKTIARCCKIGGLQCEYIKSVRQSISCYKNFQLLDCACLPTQGNCHSSMDNHGCYSTDPSLNANRYAVCCSTDKRCYVKSDSSTSGETLRVTCNNEYELMTGCSGFNTGDNIKKAEITRHGGGHGGHGGGHGGGGGSHEKHGNQGVDTCVIEPSNRDGRKAGETLTAYVSCCDTRTIRD